MSESTHVAPGQVVIDEIGLMPVVDGLRPEFPSLSKSTVWRWSQPRPVGTDGLVPSVYHRPLLNLAKRLDKTLTPEDLVYGRKVA